MTDRMHRALPLIVAAVAGFGPLRASASPAESHGGIEWITPIFGHDGPTGLLWVFINFFALLWLLEKLLFSKLRARTREKHDTIKGEIERAQSAREEAEALLGDYEAKIGRLEGEIEELMADAKRRAESERQKIVAAAEAEAERIRQAAVAAAEREAESRKRQIENEIVDRAVERAETTIRQRLTSADQRRMVGDYIGRLGSVDFTGPRGATPGGAA
jgi:F-type H+-transporting ATPase subunit b